MKAIYLIIAICLLPLFALYLALCFLSPLLHFGRTRRGKGVSIYIVGDLIHSDYIFPSQTFEEFPFGGRYVKVGWGDRKIFLETRTWGELKVENFLRAFFGLNSTVLRVDFLDDIPKGAKKLEIGRDQLEIIKDHVRMSFRGDPIERRPEDYQGGIFYESELNYNCITNCNNWVNRGLWLAGITNRLWSPLSFLS